ncbi:hypothetical protein CgunFtcFv8_012622 [Champsocephalus gunnari]|uniref:Uncharacterized protein n=1 Tax=Champsocephalus gunnari TaxID=52237 RepID=A0AAN8DRU9_CHAGU|nr:hypothetical protein CgunFtcFv8_012622 [Champsocephalus gunnari]
MDVSEICIGIHTNSSECALGEKDDHEEVFFGRVHTTRDSTHKWSLYISQEETTGITSASVRPETMDDLRKDNPRGTSPPRYVERIWLEGDETTPEKSNTYDRYGVEDGTTEAQDFVTFSPAAFQCRFQQPQYRYKFPGPVKQRKRRRMAHCLWLTSLMRE